MTWLYCLQITQASGNWCCMRKLAPDVYERAYKNAHGAVRKLHSPGDTEKNIDEKETAEVISATLP